MPELKVSIIIPTFNRAPLLGETLESVLKQTHKNWECIIVDDGSEDYTNELLGFYCRKDPRIKYTRRPKYLFKGANSCRNYGFSISSGDFIQWLDSDDILSTDKLEAQVKQLETEGGEIITCKWGKITGKGKPSIFNYLESYNNFNSPVEFLNILNSSQGYFPVHAYLMRRRLVERISPWVDSLKVNQDGEFITRAISNTEKIYFSDKGYVLYRRTADSTSCISYNDFQELIKSWNLIESYLKEKFPNENLQYIKDAKRRIFIRYREEGTLIKQNKDFFGEVIFEEPSDLQLYIFRLIFKYQLSRSFWIFFKRLRNYFLKKFDNVS